MAAQLLSNLLSNSNLSKDKDLFLDAMREVTDSIIGKADSLPPNPYLSSASAASDDGRSRNNFSNSSNSSNSAGLYPPPRQSGASNLLISTHHSVPLVGAASSSSPSTRSPSPVRIPVHHLSPLNKSATGPKEKSEQLEEFSRLRKEKLGAVERAKEEERAQRIRVRDREEKAGGARRWEQQQQQQQQQEQQQQQQQQQQHRQMGQREAFDAGAASDSNSDSDSDDGAASPAPSYVSASTKDSGGGGGGGMEDLLTGEQLKCLAGAFRRSGGREEGFAGARELARELEEDGGAGRAFGEEVVERACEALRRQRAEAVNWEEFLGLVISPGAGEEEGGRIEKGMGLRAARHVDPAVSLDLSAMGLDKAARAR